MNLNERVSRGFRVRLEQLAGQVKIDKLFSRGIETFLDIQENLFGLQIDIQMAIGVAKKQVRSTSLLAHLEELRWLRHQSRRLGDAIAWCALFSNRKVMESLSHNDPVPVPSAWSNGHRGAFHFARSRTSQDWGIPVIHDITNILRVGDVTFVKPAHSGSDADYRTLELKTKVIDDSINNSGDRVLDLTVTAIGNEPLPGMLPLRDPHAGQHKSSLSPDSRGDRRISRQLARMDQATIRKNIGTNKSTKVGDNYVFVSDSQVDDVPHWTELRRAIRLARKQGYSYFSIGGFVGYSVLYNSRGLSDYDFQSTKITENVSGLIHEEIGDRNSITVSMLPSAAADSIALSTLPYYLWEIPQNAITDILWHRLMIVATYNTGWMENLLMRAGLRVLDVKGSRDGRAFEVIADMKWPNGVTLEYHSNVWREMVEAVHEFKGPDAVVQRATIPLTLPEIIDPEDFVPPEFLDED